MSKTFYQLVRHPSIFVVCGVFPGTRQDLRERESGDEATLQWPLVEEKIVCVHGNARTFSGLYMTKGSKIKA